MKAAFLLTLVCASSSEAFSGRLQHPPCTTGGCHTTTDLPPTTTASPDIYCWSVNAVATDQWCMDNCFHPGASYCPSGFCDCNCDAGDPGCPRKRTNVLCIRTYSLFLSLVSDDATAKAKLFKVLKKSYNKVQRTAHINSLKTKTSFKSKRMFVTDIVKP